jgi:hypothetical protein
MLRMAKELAFSVKLADCTLQHFRCGGKGGQNVNKRDTGARIIHEPSGAVGHATDERSQLQNTKLAFRRMTEDPKFRIWVNRMLWHQGVSPEERVKRDMVPEKMRTEVRKDGKWVSVQEGEQ